MPEKRWSDNYEGECYFLKKGERFPFKGDDPNKCQHPSEAWEYAEWESQHLGHGWFCSLCGTLLQVG